MYLSYRNHFLSLLLFLNLTDIACNTKGATNEAGTDDSFRKSEFTSDFQWSPHQLSFIEIDNTKGTIKHVQSRETGNTGYTKHKTNTNKTKTQHNMCLTPL